MTEIKQNITRDTTSSTGVIDDLEKGLNSLSFTPAPIPKRPAWKSQIRQFEESNIHTLGSHSTSGNIKSPKVKSKILPYRRNSGKNKWVPIDLTIVFDTPTRTEKILLNANDYDTKKTSKTSYYTNSYSEKKYRSGMARRDEMQKTANKKLPIEAEKYDRNFNYRHEKEVNLKFQNDLNSDNYSSMNSNFTKPCYHNKYDACHNTYHRQNNYRPRRLHKTPNDDRFNASFHSSNSTWLNHSSPFMRYNHQLLYQIQDSTTPISFNKNISPYHNYQIEVVIPQVASQIEYYFSHENLKKDVFLISQMSKEGFARLELISNFYRVRNMTHNGNVIWVLLAIRYAINRQDPAIQIAFRKSIPKFAVEMSSILSYIFLRAIHWEISELSIGKDSINIGDIVTPKEFDQFLILNNIPIIASPAFAPQ